MVSAAVGGEENSFCVAAEKRRWVEKTESSWDVRGAFELLDLFLEVRVALLACLLGCLLFPFSAARTKRMKRLLAQHDLEAMVTSLSPLLPLVSRKSCEAGTTVLAGLLAEALEAQEASSKRTDDLKQLQPKGLMELFTPEKGSAAAKNGVQDKGQKEQPRHQQQVHASPPPPPPRQQEQQHEGGGAAVPVSPKAQEPQKRARKVSEKAANRGDEEEEDEDEAEGGDDKVKKPKKQGTNGVEKKKGKKQGVKQAEGPWNGEEHPRILKVVRCVEQEDCGLRHVEVYAKKPGRGHWQEVLFSLDSAQLSSIDDLPQKTKAIVTTSFHKALLALYGGGSQRWPNALRVALAGTTWAKGMLPGAAAAAAENGGNGMDGDFEGLGDPAAPLFDI
jgi:hypothetical protein